MKTIADLKKKFKGRFEFVSSKAERCIAYRITDTHRGKSIVLAGIMGKQFIRDIERHLEEMLRVESN